MKNNLVNILSKSTVFDKYYTAFMKRSQWIYRSTTSAIETLAAIACISILAVACHSGVESKFISNILLKIPHFSLAGLTIILFAMTVIYIAGMLSQKHPLHMLVGLNMIITGILFIIVGAVSENYPPLAFTSIFLPVFGIIVGLAGNLKINIRVRRYEGKSK